MNTFHSIKELIKDLDRPKTYLQKRLQSELWFIGVAMPLNLWMKTIFNSLLTTKVFKM